MMYLESAGGKKSGKYRVILIIIWLVLRVSVSGAEGLHVEEESGMRTIRFHESEEYFVNPHMGAVAQAKNTEREVEGSLVVANYTWKEIERKKGEYSFEAAEARNHTELWLDRRNNSYMLGLVMDVPKLLEEMTFDAMDIPEWLYEELKTEAKEKYLALLSSDIVSEAEKEKYREMLRKVENDAAVLSEFNRRGSLWADIPEVGTFYRYSIDTPTGAEYRCGFSPNYSSPLVVEYHGRLMRELAKRYDNEKTYAILMGSLGHWGEMHTFFIKDPKSPGRYPPQEIARKYEEEYAEHFKNVAVSVRYPRETAKKNGFGLHCHAFGDHVSVYDQYLRWVENGYTDESTGTVHPPMKDFWKTAPSGGEFLYTGDARYLKDENIEETIQQARDAHLTWFNEMWYGLDEETERNQRRFFGKIGYRLVPKTVSYSSEVEPQGVFRINSMWENKGTAPFYLHRKIRAVLKDGAGREVYTREMDGCLYGWMPNTSRKYGATFLLPRKLKSGRYFLYLGICNSKTEKPDTKLAVREKAEDGLYFVGEVSLQGE